jgi:hypothetical protein
MFFDRQVRVLRCARGLHPRSLTLGAVALRRDALRGEVDAVKSIVLSLPPCVSLVSMLAGLPKPHRSRASQKKQDGLPRIRRRLPGVHQAVGRQRGAGVVGLRCGTKTSWPPSVLALPDRSGLRRGSAAEGRGCCWKMTRPSGSSRVVRLYRGLSGLPSWYPATAA